MERETEKTIGYTLLVLSLTSGILFLSHWYNNQPPESPKEYTTITLPTKASDEKVLFTKLYNQVIEECYNPILSDVNSLIYDLGSIQMAGDTEYTKKTFVNTGRLEYMQNRLNILLRAQKHIEKALESIEDRDTQRATFYMNKLKESQKEEDVNLYRYEQGLYRKMPY